MKNKNIYSTRPVMALVLCLGLSLAPAFSNAQTFTDDKKLEENYLKSVDSLLAIAGTVSAEDAQRVLLDSGRMATVNGLKPSRKVLRGNDLYEQVKRATVITGCAYLCPRCSNMHLSESSGYLIDPKGIMVTNYHVTAQYAFMKDGNKPIGFFARLANGRTYALKSVLAASKKNDLAILQLETGGETLPALALGKPGKVGDPVYVLGHPKGMHYFLSQGIVNNNYLEEAVGGDGPNFFREMMVISADYATGSSGGPVLDASGNVIGTVSNTKMLLHSEMNPSVQMVLKNTVPVVSLQKLLNK